MHVTRFYAGHGTRDQLRSITTGMDLYADGQDVLRGVPSAYKVARIRHGGGRRRMYAVGVAVVRRGPPSV